MTSRVQLHASRGSLTLSTQTYADDGLEGAYQQSHFRLLSPNAYMLLCPLPTISRPPQCPSSMAEHYVIQSMPTTLPQPSLAPLHLHMKEYLFSLRSHH